MAPFMVPGQYSHSAIHNFYPGAPAGCSLRGHHDGQWQCRYRRGGGRGLQPSTLVLHARRRRKISAIFVAMGIGPITGMGYLAYDAAMKDAAPEQKFIDRCGCATAT